MTFIHGYLLAGLALAGAPVLIHLIRQQQPRRLAFPAFRFLRQRALSNRRKLRLQHLLLLLVRMLVIAALCIALARPRLTADPLAVSDTRPVMAVLLFDTSPSMEYTSGGLSRLDEARQRARELLDEMADGSQVVILDSGDQPSSGEETWLSAQVTRSRLDGLRIRPANGPLNPHIERGLRLLEKAGGGDDPPPRFLYVLSDRTRACWDTRSARVVPPENVAVLFVDVGVERPQDLAIETVEVVPSQVAPGEKMQVQVSVRTTGARVDTELTCQMENDLEKDRPPERQAIKLEAGGSRVVIFERAAPSAAEEEATYSLKLQLASADALLFNNAFHTTFQTRPRRRVLTLVDGKARGSGRAPWEAWQIAAEVNGFKNVRKTLEEAESLAAGDLADFPVVCLFQAAPNAALWRKLTQHVKRGGGLVIVPGGYELDAARLNEAGEALLPGRLEKIVQRGAKDPMVSWSPWNGQHPITAYFLQAIRTQADLDFADPASRPAVRAYWEVKPHLKDTQVLATYADREQHPALLERLVGRGHVLLLTTPMDVRYLEGTRRWHNYWQDSSFGVALVDRLCRYLAGEDTPPQLNFWCGQPIRLELPASVRETTYTLQGPSLSLAEATVHVPTGERQVALPQVVVPGSYSLLDSKGRVVAGCSVNIRPEESRLDRVPAGEIEAALGARSLVEVGRAPSLKEALSGSRPPPLELLPWLLIATLLVLTLESLLANYFNRRKGSAPVQAAGEQERALA